MKKLFSFLLIPFILFAFSFSIYAQKTKIKENDTINCIQVIGIAMENGIPVDGIQVTLYRENEGLEWDEITSVKHHEHHFSFHLLGNSYYTVEVSKPGYVTRSVGFSTMLPDEIKINGVEFTFDYEVDLFKKKEGLDYYYLDFPIALVAFDKKAKVFQSNARYTKHIKTKIKETMDK